MPHILTRLYWLLGVVSFVRSWVSRLGLTFRLPLYMSTCSSLRLCSGATWTCIVLFLLPGVTLRPNVPLITGRKTNEGITALARLTELETYYCTPIWLLK